MQSELFPESGIFPEREIVAKLEIEFKIPLPKSWGGFEFDGLFFMIECYVAEFGSLRWINTDDAIYYLGRCLKWWITLPHEEFLYGGKHKDECKKVLAAGTAWLCLLNGEIELFGRTIKSPFERLSSNPTEQLARPTA